MGMFDEVICKHPLPGDPPAFVAGDHLFQSKNLDCTMATYEITAGGRLVRVASTFGAITEPTDEQFHGELAFYSSNLRGANGKYQFTENGEDAESVDYLARFDRGRLIDILEVSRTREPALPRSMMDAGYCRPTTEDIAAQKTREAESLVGREVFVAWGGTEAANGYAASIVAEGPYEWVARQPNGRMEVLDRGLRDRIIFDSREDAVASEEADRLEREQEQREFDAALAARQTG